MLFIIMTRNHNVVNVTNYTGDPLQSAVHNFWKIAGSLATPKGNRVLVQTLVGVNNNKLLGLLIKGKLEVRRHKTGLNLWPPDKVAKNLEA